MSQDQPSALNAGTHEGDTCVTYLRVSTKKQLYTAIDIDPDGNSITTQREITGVKANNLGATVIKEFIEPGHSAKTLVERPVFRELLAYLQANQGIKYVVVYMRSRAFRNHFDAAIVQVQLQKMGIRLVSAKEDFGEGPTAVAMEGMLDIMNGLQNTLQGLDVQTKMSNKAKAGGTIGLAKLGYRNVRVEYDGRPVNTIALDPVRAPLVRKAWELYATGDFGLERLEATMADLGLTARASGSLPERPVSFKYLHRMLQDPYYLGYVVYKGELHPGRHDPIVDQQLFDRVQEVVDFRSKNGQRDRVLQHYLKGLLFCERCERNERTSRLIYTEAKGRNGTRYGYFLCRGRQDGVCDLQYLAADRVEDAIVEHYADLRLPANFAAGIRERIEVTLADEHSNVKVMHAALTRKLRDLDLKEERLLDLAADGNLPQIKIKSRLRAIQGERSSAEAGLSRTGAEMAVGVAVLTSAIDLVADPRSLYIGGSDEIRRNLNQTFFHCLYLDEEGVKGDVLKTPFDDLHSAINHASQSNVAELTTPATKRGSRSAGASHRTRNSRSSSQSSPSGLTFAEILSDPGSSKASLVELPGIEPGSSAAFPGLLRVQSARSLLGSPGLANKPG